MKDSTKSTGNGRHVVSRSSPEQKVHFSPEVQKEQGQGFGIVNPLKRSGIVMTADDK